MAHPGSRDSEVAMDLLANYDDGENSENTAISDKIEKSPSPAYPKMSTASLEREMEDFERSLHGADPHNSIASIPLPVPAPVSHIPLPSHSRPSEKLEPSPVEVHSSTSSDSESRSPPSKPHSPSSSGSTSSEEEHLPKANSSGSSAHSSGHSSPVHSEGKASSAQASSPKSAASRSRSRSQSTSKVQSHSPSHSRRRRLPDHSRRRGRSSGRHHRSRHGGRSRHSHGSREQSNKRHSRSHSRDRHRRKHRRHSSRSKSRRSPHRSHRHHSRSPREKSSRRSHSRSPASRRRRSHSAEKRSYPSAPEPRKLTYKEQLRRHFLTSCKLMEQNPNGALTAEGQGVTLGNPCNLTLSVGNMYPNATSSNTTVTPQMALLQTMAAMHQKAQEVTGIPVPKFYNPTAVNPIKYAEQVQKRKLLWSKNKEKAAAPGQWQSSTFLPDQDGKQTAKFRKLMGMKTDAVEDPAIKEARTTETVRKQEELFSRLDKEYEFARMTTHTHRGVGLGFQSHNYYHHQ